MKSKYILKHDGLEYAIREGDVILDKGFEFKVLPAAMDFTKPITRKKLTHTPLELSERLLQIKELGKDSAVVAILHQEYYTDTDTLEIKETKNFVTVKYGEEFSVYAKEQYQARGDAPATTYSFIIVDKSKPQEQAADESESQEQSAPNFCTECGTKLIKGDKFCRKCGTPVMR